MSEAIEIYKANNHEEASSCLSNLIATNIMESKSNDFSIGLSGGSTPKLAYSMMLNDISDFSNITLWTIDDRWVPLTDENSNQKMINSNFSQTNSKILAIKYSGDNPHEDAELYSQSLKENITTFDSGVIGLGDDGHIASLFPNTAGLEETDNLFIANEVNIISKWRITSTFKLLSNISNLYLLVTGENKKDILSKALNGSDLPVNKLLKMRENTVIITDLDV
jgi:6-phosphogluconolactonase|tara:strand:+ start:3247 stop:3915 length:669 start_codon:yes stop_codon:yes gene_type:complete